MVSGRYAQLDLWAKPKRAEVSEGRRFLRFVGGAHLAHRDAFDGMVMHGAWTFPGSALRSAARRARKPYGIFVHGALDPWFDR